MSEDHVLNLTKLRAQLIETRRKLAVNLAQPGATEQTQDQFIKAQAAIDVVDRACKTKRVLPRKDSTHEKVDELTLSHRTIRRLTMTTGVVKFYNPDKGYGFVKPDDGGPDVFVHVSALEQAGIHNLPEGARVSFDAVIDQRKGKTNAQNVKLL